LEFWARGKYGQEGGEEVVGSRKPKYHPSFKNPHIKIDLLPRGQKSLKLLYHIMNPNTSYFQIFNKPPNYATLKPQIICPCH
jgi:hypothetical protein